MLKTNRVRLLDLKNHNGKKMEQFKTKKLKLSNVVFDSADFNDKCRLA